MAMYSRGVYKQGYTATLEINSLLMSNSSLSSAAELPAENAMSKHDQQSFSQRFVDLFSSSSVPYC